MHGGIGCRGHRRFSLYAQVFKSRLNGWVFVVEWNTVKDGRCQRFRHENQRTIWDQGQVCRRQILLVAGLCSDVEQDALRILDQFLDGAQLLG